jgi:glycosyltransferase involved in cell wall biosynthesis
VSRPRILCLSLSPIHRDARVLRQLDVLAAHGDVTTVGYGPAPAAATEHLEVDAGLASLPQTPRGVAMLAARRLRAAESVAPAMVEARRLLAGRRFDLVVANEARILPVAMDIAAHGAAPVWADMHEWAPEERSHVTSWRLLVAPLMAHICREYLPRAAAVTTVGESIAQMYRRSFGIECAVVRNARPFVDLQPSSLEPGVTRLVHSGGAVPGRNIEALIEATTRLPATTLDLILVPGNDGGKYLRQLRDKAAGSGRIRFHDAVTPDELPAALNPFDVGVYCLPPANVNMEYALPNKLFDFVQGRLAMVVGPSPEMGRFVREHRLGAVSPSFGVDDFTETIAALTPDVVAAAKQSAHDQARLLSSDTDVAQSHDIVARLLARA